ncbi:MAG: tol-pal system protein YbgF [Acidobacteriota bacterium]
MKRFNCWIVFFLVFSLWLLPVKKDTKLLLVELQKISNLLEKELSAVSTELSALRKKIDIIDAKITAITKSQADTEQTKETTLLSLQFLKEELNEIKNQIGKMNDKLITIPSAPSKDSQKISGDDSESNQNSVQSSPDSIYYTAYSDYIKKNYQLAIEGFRQFVNLYPDNVLADNSLYWIGECYYAKKDFNEAIKVFSDLIDKYSNGDKVPDALLKKGYALLEVGKSENGISVLKELISKYPLSEEAYLAKQKIKDLSE